MTMTESTISAASDYYGTRIATRLVRLGLGLSEQLWPAFAARAAHNLFCTPLPLKWANRKASAWDGWEINTWSFEFTNLTLYEMPCDARPVALLIHGWGGHAAQMLPLARQLDAAGLRPVIVEMPAHGRSGGARSSLPQFARAVSYVAARIAERGLRVQALIAHSLGANASAYAAGRGVSVERLVLIAPPASPTEYTRIFAHAFALRESTRVAMQQKVEAREGITMGQFEPEAAGPRLSTPTLVVHDRGDRINPYADGEAFARHITGAELVSTTGLGHRRILSDATVMRAVAEFATK
jgi:pimeloyl-ACP methyl ester carboxylesterase